ncbi:MAG: DUF5069 domain-containing protein [Candidatus Eremiobacteraeota bacterium]|nr:DUF5069 domain-containing protein [Candidatus Eremiobacteraeota bacterium]MBV8263288.1 DUF5069 domain-containing protein [Candidatus Eremiobacteraeota bacterium]MBV8339499.1 DUF5069 domain-containing protein [Candidatus Eremiobacteraeota bacterium]MBV8459943.1 DUF5069 domain-containing protein [Candidatus Eremiobacteraeota bacterium]MBV8594779.1 DUF5069 domain-containing protein [Candidatus Eremiobacteraeota bacterium]
MAVDFRDGKTFPRRGRQPLGDFLWLARMFDKARAKAGHTQDGYIYPCPMDRAMLRRWGIRPSEFTAAAEEYQNDSQILSWLAERVDADRREAANAWLLGQGYRLDRQDADEGVAGAVAPFPWRDIMFGIAIVAVSWIIAWLMLRPHHL